MNYYKYQIPFILLFLTICIFTSWYIWLLLFTLMVVELLYVKKMIKDGVIY